MPKVTRNSLTWCYRHQWVLLVVGLSLASLSPAADSDVFNAGFLTDSTSDGYDRAETVFTYRNHRRAYVWPWEESDATTMDWGLSAKHLQGSVGTQQFNANQVMGMLGTNISPAIHLEGWLGTHWLKVSNVTEQKLASYSANVYLTPNETLTLRLEKARDYVYQEDLLPAGITDQLIARTSRLGYVWRPLSRIRIVGNSRWRNFDDGNSMRHNTLNLLYGISPGWPWVWVGVGGEKLNYAETKSGYWTPLRYSAYGLRFDGNFPITEWLNGVVQFNLDRIKENELNGTGKYLAAGVEFRLSSALSLKVDASRVRSVQSGSAWTANTYMLSLAGALF